MVTIFTIPKPFENHNEIIQRNAIKSWLNLQPECEIILMGDARGAAEIASELGLKYFPEIEKNNFGTPLVNSAFNIAKIISKNGTLAYINTDVILMDDLIATVRMVNKPIFLIIGRRWDLEVDDLINFERHNWHKELRQHLKNNGKLHGFSGIDYFVFPKNLSFDLPPFAVGRQGWDNWFIWYVKTNKIPVIDATNSITAIHQQHDYSHSKYGERDRVGGPEIKTNFRLAGGFSRMLTIMDADLILRENILERPNFIRRIYSALSIFYPWLFLLVLKRKIQKEMFSK